MFCLIQTHVRPRVACVSRLVDAISPWRGLPVLRLTCPNPDEIRVCLMQRDVTDRSIWLIIEERCPRGPVVHGLPDSARSRTDVEHLRFGFYDSKVGDAAAHERRAYRSKLQV